MIRLRSRLDLVPLPARQQRTWSRVGRQGILEQRRHPVLRAASRLAIAEDPSWEGNREGTPGTRARALRGTGASLAVWQVDDAHVAENFLPLVQELLLLCIRVRRKKSAEGRARDEGTQNTHADRSCS